MGKLTDGPTMWLAALWSLRPGGYVDDFVIDNYLRLLAKQVSIVHMNNTQTGVN